MLNKKLISYIGLLIAVSAVFLDPSTIAALSTVIGPAAAAKVAAAGALIAAIGKGLTAKSE